MALTAAERQKLYRLRHPERVKAIKKRYYASHPEQRKKEKKLDYLRYRDKYIQRAKEWYKKHKDKVKQRAAEWKKKHRAWQIYDARRKAKLKKLGGSFTLQEWEEKKRQYGYRCAICGRSEEELLKETGMGLTVDHIIPIIKWEEYTKKYPLPYKCNDIENIQPLCISCNASKQDKIMEGLHEMPLKDFRQCME